jgi:hypothetical protein
MQVLVVEVISTPAYAGCQLPGDEIRSLDVADGSIAGVDRVGRQTDSTCRSRPGVNIPEAAILRVGIRGD